MMTRPAALRALAATAAVAASAFLWHNLPVPTQIWAPFDVDGAPGETVTGRSLSVTVSGARLGPTALQRGRPMVEAAGEWLVVDAAVDATTVFVKPVTELRVGADTYVPTDRFWSAQLGGELAPGITQRGSWVFDVAPERLAGVSEVSLRVWQGDSRLDSRVVVTIPLADVVRDDPLVVRPVESTA